MRGNSRASTGCQGSCPALTQDTSTNHSWVRLDFSKKRRLWEDQAEIQGVRDPRGSGMCLGKMLRVSRWHVSVSGTEKREPEGVRVGVFLCLCPCFANTIVSDVVQMVCGKHSAVSVAENWWWRRVMLLPFQTRCRKDVWESDSNREENQKPLTKAGQSDVTLRLCELFA